jgi:thiamine monophosphate synthase
LRVVEKAPLQLRDRGGDERQDYGQILAAREATRQRHATIIAWRGR